MLGIRAQMTIEMRWGNQVLNAGDNPSHIQVISWFWVFKHRWWPRWDDKIDWWKSCQLVTDQLTVVICSYNWQNYHEVPHGHKTWSPLGLIWLSVLNQSHSRGQTKLAKIYIGIVVAPATFITASEHYPHEQNHSCLSCHFCFNKLRCSCVKLHSFAGRRH